YVLQGLNYPLFVYLFHAVKLTLLVAGWMFFCRFTPGLGTIANFGSWIFHDVAFQKAYIWASLFEVMGFGCMSGPLGLRIWAPFPDLPLFGGRTRTWLDVTLYVALLASLLRALVQPAITPEVLLPVVILLPLCGLGDKTIFL